MHRLASLAAGAFALAAALPVYATDHPVAVGGSAGLAFTPSDLTINVGDTVVFSNAGGFHNVVADDGSFRCANGCDGDGAGGNGNASSATWTARVTFSTAGSVPYHCQIHEGSGMVGTITVVGGTTPTVDVTPPALTASAPAGTSTSTNFTIGNTGTAELGWNVDSSDGTCATPNAVPWIVLNPTSGSVPPGADAASVDVTLDATALTPGAYSANICVHSNDAANDPVTLPVQFTVGASDIIFKDGFDG